MKHRRPVAAVLTAISVVALHAPVSAHIDPDPKQAQAGTATTVGFTVEHGCAGSPTVALDMRLPDGVGAPSPVPPDGWEGTVEGRVVSFVGGPLPDDQQLTFGVDMILPATPDTTIYFPFVQRCEEGEIRWIDLPADDSNGELDEPAPAMLLVGPVAEPAAPDTTAPPDTTAAPTTVAPDTTRPAGTTTVTPTTTTPPTPIAPDTTTEPDTTTPTTTIAPDTTTEATTPPDAEAIDDTTDADADGDGGASWPLIALGIAAVAAIGAGVVAYRRRP